MLVQEKPRRATCWGEFKVLWTPPPHNSQALDSSIASQNDSTNVDASQASLRVLNASGSVAIASVGTPEKRHSRASSNCRFAFRKLKARFPSSLKLSNFPTCSFKLFNSLRARGRPRDPASKSTHSLTAMTHTFPFNYIFRIC